MKIGPGLRLISTIRTRFYMRFSFDRQEKKLLNDAVHHGGFVGTEAIPMNSLLVGCSYMTVYVYKVLILVNLNPCYSEIPSN